MTLETSRGSDCANSKASADLGDSRMMMAHLNTTAMVLGWCVGGREVEGGFCGLALGAGLSPTQVINTLINSSAHIIIKTTGRKWWGVEYLNGIHRALTCSVEPV